MECKYPIEELENGVYKGDGGTQQARREEVSAKLNRAIRLSRRRDSGLQREVGLTDFQWEHLTYSKKIIGLGRHTIERSGTYGTFKVAIKEVKDIIGREAVDVFMKEALLMKKLRHPFIMPFLASGFNEDGKLLIVQGQGDTDLGKMMDMRGGEPLPLELCLKWGIQIAEALDYLHTCKPRIIHRDLNPANVLLTENEDLCLTDYGLSLLFDSLPRTNAHQALAPSTLHYTAPEVRKELHYNERVDVYSFGCLMYLMLSGHEPGQDLEAQLQDADKEGGTWAIDPVDCEGTRIPADLVGLVRDCCGTKWKNRPRMDQVLQRLGDVALKCGEGIPSKPNVRCLKEQTPS